MYLMDRISQMAGLIAARGGGGWGFTPAAAQTFAAKPLSDGGGDDLLRGLTDLAERLHGAPRFILDPTATRTMVELNLGRPKVTFDALEHIRVPYSKMWVEWDDGDRAALRNKFDRPLTHAELRPMPGRVGFLLEAEKGGRAGTATWAWTTPQSEDYPNIGAVQPYFDLDQHFSMPPERVEALLKGNLAELWLDNPVQLKALFDIWSTAVHRPSPWGEVYFRALGNNPLAVSLSYADTVGEYIAIWAIVLMLTTSRPVVDLKPVDLSRLNKQRAKRREPALLDHTRVALRLTPQEHRPIMRGEAGFGRKSPRVHLVSRYLAHRGDKHWLVEPYFRGKGKTISRHVHVKG
jgi:hypothetical protein